MKGCRTRTKNPPPQQHNVRQIVHVSIFSNFVCCCVPQTADFGLAKHGSLAPNWQLQLQHNPQLHNSSELQLSGGGEARNCPPACACVTHSLIVTHCTPSTPSWAYYSHCPAPPPPIPAISCKHIGHQLTRYRIIRYSLKKGSRM